MQIGELARLGGVSVKALRFYDEQGLLRPEHVDAQTGYRYYTLEQAAALAAITNLRLIDFSIAEIAHIMRDGVPPPDEVKAAIRKKQAALADEQARLADKQKIADILAQSAASGAAPPPTLKLTPIAPQRVFALRQRVPHLGEPVTKMFETAETRVGENQARATLPPFLIFHDPPETKTGLDVEVCIPVLQAAPEQAAVTIIGGADIACAVVYAGGYFKTDTLFAQMTGWIHNAGLQPAGPLREVYHRFGADQDDYRLPKKMTARNAAEYLTELQIPIRMNINSKEND
ncbi:MerR family transcriptional regulator [Hyphococcus sp.]|uniref:MerR family transcriptional regulator n=1 Tax=Hyphococcus sp. TaxID=2038636 RepID=UPI003CCB7856